MKIKPGELTKSFLKLPLTKQEAILTAAVEYATLNEQEKLLKTRKDKVFRPIVEGAVMAYGTEDQNQNLHLVMEDTEVIRTRKVSRTLNSVAAEALLEEKGLTDSCMIQVVSWEIDEEKLVEAYHAGKITAEELDGIFSENISWATSVKTTNEEVVKIQSLRKEIEKGGELPEIEC